MKFHSAQMERYAIHDLYQSIIICYSLYEIRSECLIAVTTSFVIQVILSGVLIGQETITSLQITAFK